MWVGEHLLIDLLVAADDFPELLREVRRSVLNLNHHEVVGLEVDFENENETHLALGRQNLDGVLHQNVLLWFLSGCLLGVRADSLDHNL